MLAPLHPPRSIFQVHFKRAQPSPVQQSSHGSVIFVLRDPSQQISSLNNIYLHIKTHRDILNLKLQLFFFLWSASLIPLAMFCQFQTHLMAGSLYHRSPCKTFLKGEAKRRGKTILALVRSLRHPLFLAAHPTDIGFNQQDKVHQIKLRTYRKGMGGKPHQSCCCGLPDCFPASPVSRVPNESESGSPSVRIKPRLFQRRRAVRLCSTSRPPLLPFLSSKVQPVPLFFTVPKPQAATSTRSSIPSCEQDLMTQSNKCGVPPISLLSSF